MKSKTRTENRELGAKSLGLRTFLLLAVILMMGSVYALGVSPGRTTIDFEPGAQNTVSFEITNSRGEDIELSLSVDGELSEYIEIGSDKISISASEESKVLSYTINFPDSLEPGVRKGRVIAMEVPKDVDADNSYVGATLAVATQIYVNVLYPGKYATSEMIIRDASEGGDVRFIFPVESKGEFDLDSVGASVDIYNSLDEKVSSFNTGSIGISSRERREIVYEWRADVPVGEYRAVATVNYDEGVIDLEGVFNVGSRDLELLEISVNDFVLGEIVKLEMLVESKWSEPIDGAFIRANIENNLGDVVSDFESGTYSVEPLSKQVFESYWDTAGVEVGNYNAEVSINYGDKSSRKNLEFQVEENRLTIIGLGYVISAGDGGSDSLVKVLVIVIVLLVMVNLVWFLWVRKRLKR